MGWHNVFYRNDVVIFYNITAFVNDNICNKFIRYVFVLKYGLLAIYPCLILPEVFLLSI